jgi:hypothetical protein
MNDAKYIGLDVHQATISATVLDSTGKLLMESILETKAATILQFVHGLRGSLHVTFEEGTCAHWLHDLLKPHVSQVIVCDPRKNALLKAGNKNDRIDARKLADLLRSGLLSPVYHGENKRCPERRFRQARLGAWQHSRIPRGATIARRSVTSVQTDNIYLPSEEIVLKERYNVSVILSAALKANLYSDYLCFERMKDRVELHFRKPTLRSIVLEYDQATGSLSVVR